MVVYQNGEWIYWIYNTIQYINEYRLKFPEATFLEPDFINMVRKCVTLFKNTGSIHSKDGSARPSIYPYR